MLFKKLDKALSSYYVAPCFFLFALICFFLEQSFLCVAVVSFLICAILVFSKDVKNIFPLICYGGFYIKNIYRIANGTLYGICIGVVVVGIISFVIVDYIKKGGNYKLGSMFLPLVILDFAFCIGGIFANFHPKISVIILGLSFVILLLYLIAINNTKNLLHFLMYIFVVGAVYVSVEIFINKLLSGHLLGEMDWFFAENPNTASLFISLGIIGVFSLFFKKENDYFSVFLIFFLFFAVYITKCRQMIGLSVIAVIGLFIYSMINSRDKLLYFLAGFISVSIIFTIIVFSGESLETFIDYVLVKFNNGGLSGRDRLWAWCWKTFKAHPILGYGFIDYNLEVADTLTGDIFILAHNTPLQLLCSLGVVGTALACVFYFFKYKLVIGKIDVIGIAGASVFMIALNGITDQSAIMDTFIYIISIILIAAIDKQKAPKTTAQKVGVKK